jgi:phospholipase/carboxylesterase
MLKFIEINPIQQANACVIWLHGLGADGQDFVPVVNRLNLPHICFRLPHAPYKKVSLNNGYEMRAWYDIYGLNGTAPQDADGINVTKNEIDAMIMQAISDGIPPCRIALAGFSQGGAIALHTALRFTETLAGVIALSTYLPLSETLTNEKIVNNQNTAIFMAHGTHDDVITLATAEKSKDVLIKEHYTVDWHTYTMAHNVNEQEISDIQQFLTRILPKKA